MFEKPYSKYEYNDAVLSGLLSIALASLTQLLLKSPNIFMNVRQDVPREILVHEEHTGAWRCSAATADWTAIRIANLIFVYLVDEEYIPCTDKQVYGHESNSWMQAGHTKPPGDKKSIAAQFRISKDPTWCMGQDRNALLTFPVPEKYSSIVNRWSRLTPSVKLKSRMMPSRT